MTKERRMKVTKSIKIIVERIVICEDVKRAFSDDSDKKMYHRYEGKVDAFKETLHYLGMNSPQANYLVEIERERRKNGGEISEC